MYHLDADLRWIDGAVARLDRLAALVRATDSHRGGVVMLRAKDLALRFGETPALDGAAIDVARGEIVAVMGPSGSGKSTLLYLLAGILRPDRGEVHLGDQRHRHARRRRPQPAAADARSGFVLQFGDLVPELSLRENVELPLRLLGVRRAGGAGRAAELLRALEVDEHADRRPGQVSGGQAQRVAVARALVHRPAGGLRRRADRRARQRRRRAGARRADRARPRARAARSCW